MSDVRRFRPTVAEVKATAYCGEHPDGEYVLASDYDALDRDSRKRYDEVAADALRLDAELKAVIQDCHIMCNALQRIEAGEAEPRMIARRTLEHWSEKSALAAQEKGHE